MTGSLFARLCGFAWWLRLAGFASCLGLLVLASFLAPEGAAEVATPYLRNLAHAPLFGLFALSFLVLSGPQAPLRPRADFGALGNHGCWSPASWTSGTSSTSPAAAPTPRTSSPTCSAG